MSDTIIIPNTVVHYLLFVTFTGWSTILRSFCFRLLDYHDHTGKCSIHRWPLYVVYSEYWILNKDKWWVHLLLSAFHFYIHLYTTPRLRKIRCSNFTNLEIDPLPDLIYYILCVVIVVIVVVQQHFHCWIKLMQDILFTIQFDCSTVVPQFNK